jgi:hypothetical protein
MGARLIRIWRGLLVLIVLALMIAAYVLVLTHGILSFRSL